MTISMKIKKLLHDFLRTRASNDIEHQQVIVYLLHVVLIVVSVLMQFLGMGGSQQTLPLMASGLHLAVCIVAFALYLARRLTVPQAMTIVAIVSQGCVALRYFYLSTTQADPDYLLFIMGQQMTTVLAIFFLVMAFVRYTPFVVAFLSLVSYALTASYLHIPSLWRVFSFFVFIDLLVCVLGEVLRRNVTRVTDENKSLHSWELAMMRAVRLNRREIEGYLRMSANSAPTADDVDRLFSMFTARSQRNIINAVRIYMKSHLSENSNLSLLTDGLTKTEREVCNLVLKDKKRSEICQLLGKSDKNIDVVRSHIRSKLNVPPGMELKQFLLDWLEENSFPLVEIPSPAKPKSGGKRV